MAKIRTTVVANQTVFHDGARVRAGKTCTIELEEGAPLPRWAELPSSYQPAQAAEQKQLALSELARGGRVMTMPEAMAAAMKAAGAKAAPATPQRPGPKRLALPAAEPAADPAVDDLLS